MGGDARKGHDVKTIEAYDSAYPGSMCQREDGSFIRREDAESLAGALLALIKSGDRAAEDLQDALTEAKKDAELYAKKDQENYELRAALGLCWSLLPDGEYGVAGIELKRTMTRFNCWPHATPNG